MVTDEAFRSRSGHEEGVEAGVLNTLATYAQSLDAGRLDELVGLFCDDAVVDIMGLGSAEGREAIRASYGTLAPGRPQLHLLSNIRITATGDGEASTVSDLTMLSREDSGWQVALTGRYVDVLRREQGTWRFASKTLTFTP